MMLGCSQFYPFHSDLFGQIVLHLDSFSQCSDSYLILSITSTEATEVGLVLFNDLHVQQALSLVSQHQELTEVLKVWLQVTEDLEPVEEPPEINPVVWATIKSVDKREGTIPTPIPSEREYSYHTFLALGLNNQEAYSRLS